MEVIEQRLLTIREPSRAGEARRLAQGMAERMGFDAATAGSAALVTTEVATNLVKHAHDGQMLLFASRDGAGHRVGVLALDRGPGIADMAAALADGTSTAGSPGTGLGAIARSAAEFDIHSGPSGTVLFAGIRPRGRSGARPGVRIGAVSLPLPGEWECGDAFAVVEGPGRLAVLLVDGLGHGAGAAAAAREAVAAFRRHAAARPGEQLTRIHEALRGTRGAAASVAELDRERRVLRFAGIGNVAGVVMGVAGTRNAVCHHGTLGHQVRRIDEFTYPWPSGGRLVLHSDGIVSRWSLEGAPGVTRRHPMLTAGVLIRDFARGRDDCTVVVVEDAG